MSPLLAPEALLATITVTPLSSMHVGSGSSRPGVADSLVVQDRHGVPFIPATHLRNNLRWWGEGILEHTPAEVCTSDTPVSCVATGDGSPCLVCKAFGSRGVPSWLVFGHARLHPVMSALIADDRVVGLRDVLLGVRSHVKIDAVRGSQEPRHLYSNEVSVAGVPFISEVHGAIHAGRTDELIPAVDVLWLSTRIIPALGRRRRRGYGEVSVAFSPSEGLKAAGWTTDAAAERIRGWYE